MQSGLLSGNADGDGLQQKKQEEKAVRLWRLSRKFREDTGGDALYCSSRGDWGWQTSGRRDVNFHNFCRSPANVEANFLANGDQVTLPDDYAVAT